MFCPSTSHASTVGPSSITTHLPLTNCTNHCVFAHCSLKGSTTKHCSNDNGYMPAVSSEKQMRDRRRQGGFHACTHKAGLPAAAEERANRTRRPQSSAHGATVLGALQSARSTPVAETGCVHYSRAPVVGTGLIAEAHMEGGAHLNGC